MRLTGTVPGKDYVDFVIFYNGNRNHPLIEKTPIYHFWIAHVLYPSDPCVCVLVAQSSPTLCNLTVCPWNSLGKNTGVGCHFLLQGNLHNPGIEPRSPALQPDSFV